MDPRELLKALMAAEGLNPNSLAARTGGKTLQPQIHRFIKGKSAEPKRSTLEPVARVFRVPVEAFYDPAIAQRVWQERAGLHTPKGATQQAGAESRGDAAHKLSDLQPIIKPITVEWELIAMGPGVVPDSFILAMPDDALSATTPRGTRLIFERGAPSRYGAGILVEDARGKRHVRKYAEGHGGTWRAVATNPAYVDMQSDRDGLTILARAVWREGVDI